jgi:hypothetical protein
LSGFSVLVDFFVFELDDSLVGSVVVDSLSADFSVFASDFLVLVLVLFEVLLFGLEVRSAAGLVEVAGDFVVVAGALLLSTGGFGLTLGFALEAGVVVAATDAVAAGVMVTAAVAAGLALAFVEAEVLVVVLGAVVLVVPVVVVPLVVDALTPNVVGTVTP